MPAARPARADARPEDAIPEDARPETVLVTGGNGLLGRHLVAALRAAGDRVRVVVRPGRDAPAGCEVARGDFTDAAVIRDALRSVDAVYHLAAITRKWLPDRAGFQRVNVDAAVQLARLAAAAGVARVVHVSSFTVYGPSPPGVLVDETAAGAPAQLQNDYQRSKHRAHEALLAMGRRGEAPVVVACPGVVYGAGEPDRPNPIADLMRKQLAGRLATFPQLDRRWTLAWAPDVAAGLRRARTHGAPGRSYLLGGPVASLREVFTAVEALSGRRGPRRSPPLWPFLLLGRANELTARVTRRVPRLSAAALRFLSTSWAFSSARAQAELGYRITPLDRALVALWKDLHVRRLVAQAPPAAVPAA